MALSGVGSVCVNHPSVEAVGRCKQCSKPFCNACRVQGPTGYFCSAECKQKHEVFVKRAQELDTKKGGMGIGFLVGKLISILIGVVIIAAIVGVVGSVFNVPVLTPLVQSVRASVGM